MNFAVNYSQAAADLLRGGRIQTDRLKCPAWPDLVAAVRAEHPAYVHFPFLVGAGTGAVVDGETGRAPDWSRVEALMAQTATPVVNVHLFPRAEEHPDIPADATGAIQAEMMTERMVQDVRALVERFGPEHVVVENTYGDGDRCPRAAHLPQVIRCVVEETGCGLLLDLAHARIAARQLGTNARVYIDALPVAQVREIHVAGVQRFAGRWLVAACRAGVDDDLIAHYVGRLVDHLPMADGDWGLFAWAMVRVHSGAWGQPWVVTFEYGGVSGLFEALTDWRALAVQVPRLRALVKGGTFWAARPAATRPKAGGLEVGWRPG